MAVQEQRRSAGTSELLPMHDDCGRENIGLHFFAGADGMVKRLKHPRFDMRVWRQNFISARMPLYAIVFLCCSLSGKVDKYIRRTVGVCQAVKGGLAIC